MKIWIINHYAIPPSMGSLVRHYYFSKYLQERGHEVKIFTSSKIHNADINMINDKRLYLEKKVDGIEYTFVRTSNYKGNKLSRIINMLQFPMRIRRVCKKFEKPDVIYTSSPDLLTALSAVRIAKKMKLPKVVELRDLWPESIVAFNNISRKNPAIAMLYRLERWLYEKADRLIFTMAGAKEYIKDSGWEKKIDFDKIVHVNNGVDIEEFEYNKEHYSVEDNDLLDTSIYKVVYTGSVRKVYNLGMVLDVAKQMQKENPKVKFLIWGDGTERAELEKRCEEEGISNVVFKGRVEKKYIPYILSHADVNLMHWEKVDLVKYGCSLNKLFDYLASGRMIISDVTVGYDLLEEYRCGIVTKEQSVDELCRAILMSITMPEDERIAYSKRAIECAKAHDYKVLTEKIEKVLESARC